MRLARLAGLVPAEPPIRTWERALVPRCPPPAAAQGMSASANPSEREKIAVTLAVYWAPSAR